jgi:hypothetical protein
MLGIRLVRLIEKHSESLSRGLSEELRKSDRTSDYRKIPIAEMQTAASEVYRHLAEWLLQKTETDIAERFRYIAAQRAGEGVRLHQFVWALMLTRDYLWRFLRREAIADNIVELHGELELHRLLNQFFDRAIYYAIVGYEEGTKQGVKGNLQRAQELAISIGLMSAPDISKFLED